MTILDRLFHPRGRETPPSDAKPQASEPETGAGLPAGVVGHLEVENHGTRHDSFDKASAYWVARLADPHKDPFVLSNFDSAADARAALLELPCIHEAVDTGNLICTEVLIFGYYPAAPGTFEAVIGGRGLSHALWEQARDAFVHHGGRPKNDLEPEMPAMPLPDASTSAASPAAASSSSVVFEREEHVEQMGATFTYRIHRAPDAASAKTFLEEHPVEVHNLYLLVNTPDGTYCRDIDGMYQQ